MSYLTIALVSIGLVLLNAAIGCVLASKAVRAELVSMVRRIVRFRRSSSE